MSAILERLKKLRPDLTWERRSSSLFAGLKPNDREEFAVYWPISALKESVFVERISPKSRLACDVEQKAHRTAFGETAALAVEGLK